MQANKNERANALKEIKRLALLLGCKKMLAKGRK